MKKIIKHTVWLFLTCILAAIVHNFVVMHVIIASSSMVPTLSIGDHAIGLRVAFDSEYERGDIVVFCNDETNGKNYVKRIIGLPSETVELVKGIVYINGEQIQDYVGVGYVSSDNFGPVTVPVDCYFVLGDNRNHSEDSRATH